MTEREKRALLLFMRLQGDSLSALGTQLVQLGNTSPNTPGAELRGLAQTASAAVDEEIQRLEIFKRALALVLEMGDD